MVVARAGLGSNQYRAREAQRERPGIPAPQARLPLLDQTAAGSDRTACSQMWGGHCDTPVSPPSWSHGRHPTPAMRLRAARDPNTPQAVFTLLAQDNNQQLRCLAALRSAEPALLERLSQTSDPEVRKCVACNPRAPQELLQLLAADTEPVQACLAYNPSTPPAALERLSASSNPGIRLGVACHLNAPAAALQRLLSDLDPDITLLAADNPNLPRAARAAWQRGQLPETVPGPV